MAADKYNVGLVSRKDLAAAIEILLSGDEDTVIFRPKRRGKNRYEIRARRQPHGLRLMWAKPGTFIDSFFEIDEDLI